MNRKPYRSLGNDLFCDALTCSCLDSRFKNSEVAHLFKTVIKLSGYYDDHFFSEVNKEPRKAKCSCGSEFQYQWFPDGVEAKWIK